MILCWFGLTIPGIKASKKMKFLHLTNHLRLGEPEALKFPVSVSPRQRLLRLSVGPRLGEGPLRLGEPAILFLFPFFC